MNYPRVEWGKTKRFDFAKYLNQPLLTTSKNVTFESIRTRKILNVDEIRSKALIEKNVTGSYGWGIIKQPDNYYNLNIDNIYNHISIFCRNGVFLQHQVAAPTNIGSHGHIWTKNSVPIVLWYTDEDGTDWQIQPDDTAYNATSWDANTAPATKNVIRDQIEIMLTAIGLNTTHRGLTNNPHSVNAGDVGLHNNGIDATPWTVSAGDQVTIDNGLITGIV